MSDLKILRQGWDEVEAFETELLRKMRIEEKVLDYLQLFAEFHEWDAAVEASYQEEREKALVEIKRRLRRLHLYRKTHETGH